MEYDELDGPDGVPIRVPTGDDYRICTECGGDCEPDPSISVDSQGARIAFVCPDHGGGQSIVDPFEGQRRAESLGLEPMTRGGISDSTSSQTQS